MKPDPLQFVIDSAISNELALNLLIQTLLKFHPELADDYINALDTAISAREIPTSGAKQNIAELRATIANMPKPTAAH
ncbi:MAG: hypothetical protein HKM00_09565 [Gallionella sp.]|nr:hypothetical protein [Gallionella sp.]